MDNQSLKSHKNLKMVIFSNKVLRKRHQDIVKAVKIFNKRKKSTQNDIVDEDLDDEGE